MRGVYLHSSSTPSWRCAQLNHKEWQDFCSKNSKMICGRKTILKPVVSKFCINKFLISLNFSRDQTRELLKYEASFILKYRYSLKGNIFISCYIVNITASRLDLHYGKQERDKFIYNYTLTKPLRATHQHPKRMQKSAVLWRLQEFVARVPMVEWCTLWRVSWEGNLCFESVT
jgi:hypothetical protein